MMGLGRGLPMKKEVTHPLPLACDHSEFIVVHGSSPALRSTSAFSRYTLLSELPAVDSALPLSLAYRHPRMQE